MILNVDLERKLNTVEIDYLSRKARLSKMGSITHGKVRRMKFEAKVIYLGIKCGLVFFTVLLEHMCTSDH